jgi:hypothetical protein
VQFECILLLPSLILGLVASLVPPSPFAGTTFVLSSSAVVVCVGRIKGKT